MLLSKCFDGQEWRGSSKLFFLTQSKELISPWERTGWVMAFSSCYQRVHSTFSPSGRLESPWQLQWVQLLFARNTQQIPERKGVSVRTTELEEKTFRIEILLPELSWHSCASKANVENSWPVVFGALWLALSSARRREALSCSYWK